VRLDRLRFSGAVSMYAKNEIWHRRSSMAPPVACPESINVTTSRFLGAAREFARLVDLQWHRRPTYLDTNFPSARGRRIRNPGGAGGAILALDVFFGNASTHFARQA